MKKVAIIAVILAGISWFIFHEPTVTLGPGAKAPDAPLQGTYDGPKDFMHNGYVITPLASFELHAKVLSRKNYSFGRESDLSPTDLALGWGNMSDEAVLADIDISQSGRWYKWWSSGFPIPRKEIETSSANMHIIPADDAVSDVLAGIITGQIIRIQGALVQVEHNDGWQWKSSLTRNDTGNRACEVVWVEELRIEEE